MNSCPVCDKPIADQAYVCHRCAQYLAKRLLKAAQELPELDLTLSRQDAIEQGVGGPVVHMVVAGPWCKGPGFGEKGEWCDHDSCHQALDTQKKAELRAHREAALPNESALAFHVGAHETLSVIGNTIGTWARVVSEARGTTIVEQPTAIRRYAEPVGDGPRKGGDAAYCRCCDLPLEYCFNRTRS